jgi:hemerythrin-like domain-containing protein
VARSPTAHVSGGAESRSNVKRVRELRDLSDDHHTGLVLARRCRRVGGPDSSASDEDMWNQVLEAFSSHLEPHFRIEEQHLLPALEAIGEASLANRIREDHGALRALRNSEAPDRSLINRFGELLESHIRFEERQVFEPTQDRLPPRALAAIATACEANPRICPASLKS